MFPKHSLSYTGVQFLMSSSFALLVGPTGKTANSLEGAKDQIGRPVTGDGRLILPSLDTVRNRPACLPLRRFCLTRQFPMLMVQRWMVFIIG